MKKNSDTLQSALVKAKRALREGIRDYESFWGSRPDKAFTARAEKLERDKARLAFEVQDATRDLIILELMQLKVRALELVLEVRALSGVPRGASK